MKAKLDILIFSNFLNFGQQGCNEKYIANHCKVANSSLSRLVARFQIFRRLMKGKFDAYVL